MNAHRSILLSIAGVSLFLAATLAGCSGDPGPFTGGEPAELPSQSSGQPALSGIRYMGVDDNDTEYYIGRSEGTNAQFCVVAYPQDTDPVNICAGSLPVEGGFGTTLVRLSETKDTSDVEGTVLGSYLLITDK